MKHIIHESLTGAPVLLLVGGLLIGLLIGPEGFAELKPFAKDPFKGILCLFLLDMGLISAKRLKSLFSRGPLPIGFAVVAPAVHGLIGVAIAYGLGLGHGDALLLSVLIGSASYIAVPAAMQMAVPQADRFVRAHGFRLNLYLQRALWYPTAA